jgi:UDP-hydrolysing UDP-N-acetyl-D-glucosamine 2-epimerase
LDVRKICVVITARPSYARIKSALSAIRDHPELELQIVTTASALLSRYGDVSQVIEADGFSIAARVLSLVEGESPEAMAKTTGIGIVELSSFFSITKPDIIMTIADRYETIATAVAASFLNIPLVHVQGGEVTGNIDEKVRHAISKMADMHLTASEDARVRVIRMGEDPDRVVNTGCPSIDLASQVAADPALNLDEVLSTYGGVGADLDLHQDFIVVMQHPVTSQYQDALQQIEETLKAVHRLGLQAIWFWPNPDAGSDGTSKGIRQFREKVPENQIHFFKNMEPENFLKLLLHAKCIVGNSSVAIRECAFLGVPAVNIGSRQASRLRGGNVVDVAHDADAIMSAVLKQIEQSGALARDLIYGDGHAGNRIAEVCARMPLSIEKQIVY